LVNKYIDTNLLNLKVAEDTPVRAVEAVDMVVEAKEAEVEDMAEAEAEDMVEAAVSLSNAVIFQTFKQKFSTQAVAEVEVEAMVEVEVMILSFFFRFDMT
jgi:hypothetical protein